MAKRQRSLFRPGGKAAIVEPFAPAGQPQVRSKAFNGFD
jgi:hypothetical protein